MKPELFPLRWNRKVCALTLLLATSPAVAHDGTAHPQFLGVDGNENELSDLYEMMHPGISGANAHDDADGDGQTNQQENASGTDPLDGTDRLDFASVSTGLDAVTARWPTVAGKRYQMQMSDGLSGTWTDDGPQLEGTGGMVTGECPLNGQRAFLRLVVTDMDSDGDGATDWEELRAGTDRYAADTTGDGRTDSQRILDQLTLTNSVNVFATTAIASETGSKPLVFTFTRHGNLNALSVPYTLSGTASPGVDYAVPSGVVIFPTGATTAALTLTPAADDATDGGETIIVSVNAGSGYTIGGAASATGVIEENRAGLTGSYFNSQNTSYATTVSTIFTTAPKLVRVDPVIDFNFGAGPPAGTGQTGANSFSMRWDGTVTAPVSGTWLFQVTVDRGAVLYLGDLTTPVISQWGPTIADPSNPPVFTARLDMSAGQAIPLRLDYRESSTTPDHSGVRLEWTSPLGVTQVIPASALSADPAPPSLSGEPYAVAITGAPFVYQVLSDPPASSYAADGLPPGLTLNPLTGEITGSATGTPGLQFATLSATNIQGSGWMTLPILVIDGGGGITREVWNGLPAGNVSIASVPLHTSPPATTLLTSLSAPSNAGDQFGERIRGFLTAPVTGNYAFYLTSDESAELWISSSSEPASRLKRSWFYRQAIPAGSWSTVSTQESLPVKLLAGRRYYLEILRRETGGNDHLAVGWRRPGQTGAGPAEVVPGWALSPYAPPAAATPDGTLYIANLTPQAGAATLGTGTAILVVNPDKTAASLSFTFSNLTGPIISQHIHDARAVPGPSGGIIFDIDEEIPDAFGERHWTFTATGNHTVADVLAAVESGQAYLNLHTNSYPSGEIKGFFQPAVGTQYFVPPAAPPAAELTLPGDPVLAKQAAARFLQQATFGPRPDADGQRLPGALPSDPFGGYDPDSIEAVLARGYAQWLDDQLALDPGPDPQMVVMQTVPPTTIYETPANSRRTPNADKSLYNGAGPMASFVRDYYEKFPRSAASPNGATQESSAELWRAWWRTACTAPDQVRHRVAFALSQILVVSEEGTLSNKTRGLAHYYDLLYYHGFDNFRTVLEKATLNVSMGRYLDMLGNKKPNAATGYIPNENYGREILQLFSVGLKRLHPDGTLVLDSEGLPVPTYGQENVVGYAHTFTGWSYPADGGSTNYISDMTVTPGNHDAGEKLLLENTVLPATGAATEQTCQDELSAAHEVIFQHPNVGPFISRQLIQRMVTANPSPGYIYRVAQVFEDNGSGVRGDMKAVVRALLLDPEARNDAIRVQPGYGHVKEPIIRATQMIRAFKGYSHAEATDTGAPDLGLAVFSPSVNVNLSQPLRQETIDYTSPVASVTYSYIDEVIDPDGAGTAAAPSTFSMVVQPGSVILLRRQSAPPAGGLVVDAEGNTNSPQNGLYVLSAHGAPLVRWSGADSPAELANAWIIVSTCRRDPPDAPGGSTGVVGGGLTGNRYYQQTAVISTLGTSPVLWTESSAGNRLRQAWGIGSTGSSSFEQTPVNSPTVFNFYEPDYVFSGETGDAGLYSPEFQITNETTVITTANWFYDLTRRNSSQTSIGQSYGQGFSYGNPDKREVKLELTEARDMADNATALVDYVTPLLMPGQVSPRLRTLLINYVNTLPSGSDANRMNRVGELLYLIAMTPEAAVQR